MGALMRGASGEEVERLQRQLTRLGYYRGRIDGLFGIRLYEAISDFQHNYFVDGVADAVTQAAINRAVDSWAKARPARLLPVPHGLSQIEAQFGVIEYQNAEAGQVVITNGFEARVALHDFPIVGRQYCHEVLIPVLEATLIALEARGLDREFVQFGTWSPRHKMHDLRRSLSTHSWAIAFDLNWAQNPVGSKGKLSPQLTETICAFGWEWGGRWDPSDPMHFQYCTGY